ncbi:hypothetical protein SVAN01_02980 [Stagonosporopsis vannaccii]|nr:hypothetical protein SVAN01_02980 [Stagonosporopsis vannaccii]
MSGGRPKATKVMVSIARKEKAESEYKRLQGDNQRYREGGGEDWPYNGNSPDNSDRADSDGGPSDDIATGGNVETSRSVVGNDAFKQGQQTNTEEKKCNCNCM